MVDMYSVQVSFLLCESIFCFMAGILMLFNSQAEKKDVGFLSSLNMTAGLLLLNDFLAYVFRGRSGTLAFVMVRVTNFCVFTFSAAITFLFIMYMNFQLFGKYGVKKDSVTCKVRTYASYALLLLDVILTVITQFNGFYYSFDENNRYYRNSWFVLSVILVAIAFFLSLTVMFEYHKNVKKGRFIALSLFFFLPALGMIIQTFVYGVSLINTCIGLSIVLMFGEYNINLNAAIKKARKTEIRTGISNEHGCIEFIDAKSSEERKGFTCVFFDIKNFGLVNVKYGIQVGNLMISKYAKELEGILRDDEIIARQGSDKFIAVIENFRIKQFVNVLKNVNVQVEYQGISISENLSATVGVFKIDDGNLNGEDIIGNAQTALELAKNKSRKAVVQLTDELKNDIEDNKQLQVMIPNALKAEEFLVYYQPKVNSRDCRLCGAEALVRWMHKGELVPPGKFIPIMEQYELMCDLDFYMLEHVCRDMENWIAKGLVPPTVSVNFSRRNLSNKKLTEEIDNIVRNHHVPKKLIEIEITETIDEFPISVLKDFIDELHKYGYRVAVDDFGCGSSSLSLLREVTFDTLKIDKGFVDRAYAKDLTILSYIIKLAKAINVEVLAEGVEQSEQVDTLLNLGCEVIQGYYFDKPLPKDVFEKRIINKSYKR